MGFSSTPPQVWLSPSLLLFGICLLKNPHNRAAIFEAYSITVCQIWPASNTAYTHHTHIHAADAISEPIQRLMLNDLGYTHDLIVPIG